MYVRARDRFRSHNMEGRGTGLGWSVPNWPVANWPVPVLHLSQIQRNDYIGVFTRKPSGFEAFFCGDLASSQVTVTISGKLMIEEKGVRRSITAVDLRTWQPKDIFNRVYTGRGVSVATNWLSRLKSDGSFTTESKIVVDPATRRLRIDVVLSLKGGNEVKAEAVFQHSDLDCFLTLMDSYESRRPIGRVTGICHIAAGHFQFLSSVRKMYQPPPASSLAQAFDIILNRNRKICLLAAPNSPQGQHIRSFETMTIGSDRIDIGHVLVGIEAHRRQKPQSMLQPVRNDATTEAFMTWAGDLGSALESYAEAIANGKQVYLTTYLNDYASSADLLGDIDGINIGAIYDETESLSKNLQKYYGAKPFRRFHDYLARLTDESGKPMLTLAQQKSPKIDLGGRNSVLHFVNMFAVGIKLQRRISDKMTQAQLALFDAIVDPKSKEMTLVVDYFCGFIEAGLAKEP